MVVADASSTVLLAKADMLHHLTATHDLTIPEIVYEEAVEQGKEKGREDAYRIAELVSEDEIAVDEPAEEEQSEVEEMFGMTGGEAAAVALGRERDELVLIDDRKGINACKALDHPFTTALDIIVVLHDTGTIEQETAIDALDDLDDYGWYRHSLVNDRRDIIQGDEA